MSGTLWTQFYWSDWESDTALRCCSLAAQGLWMRMLCVAAQHNPTGYVCVNNHPLGVTEIARLAGLAETEAGELLADLERNGVFSRDAKGRIYSRRMVRDAKKRKIARKNGKSGGNPTLTKQKENPPSDNPGDNPGLKPHKPEANNQREKKKEGGADAPPPSNLFAWTGRLIRLTQADYDRWQAAYPHVDLPSSLQAADDYYSENPPDGGKWFFPVSRWLKRDNDAVLAEIRKAEEDAVVKRDGRICM